MPVRRLPGDENEETMIVTIAAIVYALGVGAFGWSYVENGVMLAWDERPWWLATIHVAFWPVLLPIEIMRTR
jgi:hypothetical protein